MPESIASPPVTEVEAPAEAERRLSSIGRREGSRTGRCALDESGGRGGTYARGTSAPLAAIGQLIVLRSGFVVMVAIPGP